MLQNEAVSLWNVLIKSGHLGERSIRSPTSSVTLKDLAHGSSLAVSLKELSGRSVLIATEDQLATAIALIELDGVARRVVLCPGDLPRTHIPSILAKAEIDALVTDWEVLQTGAFGVELTATVSPSLRILDCERSGELQTEWVLLTSGTTGLPKLALHNLSSLTGAITGNIDAGNSAIWSTFYDIRRYGGLQIFLRALLNGGSLVLSDAEEAIGDFLIRAGAEGVTHISGTPSHWRRALMSPAVSQFAPKYVRLSGEIVDQAILDNLRATFESASIVHAFASTEAGVGFDVRDCLAGFPAEVLSNASRGVEIRIEQGSLRIRSARTASRYLGRETIASNNGFVDTGDLVELRGDRYYFVGRRDGVINVGGEKVHPEEVETILNRHPLVQMSLVKGRKNPITGAIVVADVVIKSARDERTIAETTAFKNELIEMCRRALAAHKVPVAIRLVPSLDVTSSGKLARISA
jgi:acyl-CoA synthetase (AMP-forming)/AMP-acid ligase II